MVILGALTLPSMMGVGGAKNLASNAYELSGLLQQARTTAMAENTYVAVGFYPFTSTDGVPTVAVGVISSKSGLLTDISGNVSTRQQAITRPVLLKDVAMDTTEQYLSLANANPAMNTTTNTDVSTSTSGLNFSLPIQGNSSAVNFVDIIIFSPTGEAGIAAESSNTSLLQPDDCLSIGLVEAPVTKTPRIVGIQVLGLNGQVTVYQQ